ncbi:MAG: hypothetical protein ACFFEM_16360 [Candidatus Thorarchaeota archaeon]
MKPWTAIMSLSEKSIAAFLQLIAAILFLLLGVYSSNVTSLIGEVIFPWETWSYYYKDFLSPLFFVNLPLIWGAIGLVLSYGLLASKEKAWNSSLLVSLFGIILILAIFIPMIMNVQYLGYMEQFSGPEEWFMEIMHSYDSVWGTLFYLVPLSLILNLALVIYLGSPYFSVTSSGDNSNVSNNKWRDLDVQQPTISD